MTSPESPQAVSDALDYLHGDTAVSKLTDPPLTPWAVSKWRKKLPDGRVLWLAEQTGWKFTPHMLAPHLYPNPTDGMPAKQRKVVAAAARA